MPELTDASGKKSSARSAAVRAAARLARERRDQRVISGLALGVAMDKLASQENVSVKRLRIIARAALARRGVGRWDDRRHLELARLNSAMRVATAGLMAGELKAVDRVIELVRAFDRAAEPWSARRKLFGEKKFNGGKSLRK